MAYDIGPKIGIDGEAEFRKAIRDINDDVKYLGSEMKLVAAVYDENANSMEALTAKNELLQKTYDAQEKKVAEVSKVLERVRSEYGDNEAAVKKWEQVLTESKISLQKTQNELDRNSKALEQLGSSAKEVTNASENVGEAFDNMGNAANKSSEEFNYLRKAIRDINDDVKTLGTEMKVVASEFDENDDSAKALKATNEVLTRQIEAQTGKLKLLQQGLDKSRELYGDNDAKTKSWARAVNTATAELNEMERKLDSSKKGLSDFVAGMKDGAGKVADFTGGVLKGGASALVSGTTQAISALMSLEESTEEYRVAMGKLDTAFEASGYSVEAAGAAYEGLYAILGDTDSAVEAAQLMAVLAQSEQDFAEWTSAAAGIAGTFGDALPINSLIEAANETSKCGEVTGALADALNWAGISEDSFNEKLGACSSESERHDLILKTLTETYGDASEAFYKNNEELIRTRENQAKLDEITGKLGESVSGVKNVMIEKFGPALIEIGGDIADFIAGIDTEKLSGKFDEAWDKITTSCEWSWGKIEDVYNLAPSFFDGIADTVGHSFDLVGDLWEGDFDSAYDTVLKIVEDSVAGIVGTGLDIKNMFSGLSWDGDVRTALEDVKSAFSDAYQTISEIVGDIWGAVTKGAEKATTEKEKRNANGGFGDSVNAGAVSGDVYLDGKKVGKILTENTKNSKIAGSPDIEFLM